MLSHCEEAGGLGNIGAAVLGACWEFLRELFLH